MTTDPNICDRPTDLGMSLPPITGSTPTPASPTDRSFDSEDTIEVVAPPPSRVPSDLFAWVIDVDGAEHMIRPDDYEEAPG